MKPFDLLAWLKRSTAASRVPLRVEDRQVIHEIAVRVRLQK